MSQMRPSPQETKPLPRHAPAEEYREYLLSRYSHKGSVRHCMRHREEFVDAYPSLQDWYDAPLPERVSSLYGDEYNNPSFRTSLMARPYLYFLALRGYTRFDWEWLIATRRLNLEGYLDEIGLRSSLNTLTEEALRLGYTHNSAESAMRWTMARIWLHTLKTSAEAVDMAEIEKAQQAILTFRKRTDVDLYFGSAFGCYETTRGYHTHLHRLAVVLYQRGQIPEQPRKAMPKSPPPLPKPHMVAVKDRYLAARRVNSMHSTVCRIDLGLRTFIAWSARAYPDMESFAEVNRDHMLDYAESLSQTISGRTGKALSVHTQRGYLETLSVFLRDTAEWDWQGVPGRPLLGPTDLPRRPERVPRYIPEAELPDLMAAIRSLECPYQKTALLVARWSGARRGEILHLDLDCLDSYPDGTPRLRIPEGKTKKERMVPVKEEAAEAIRELQVLVSLAREPQEQQTGRAPRYLFVKYGKLLSRKYLFENPLARVCLETGLVDESGKPTVNPHRFRHTMGTEMAERGAKLHTIMKMLGHESPDMSLVYARISDRAVLEDYQKVLGPGTDIAGPLAETLHGGDLPAADVEWIKQNFYYRTELELGRCLRLPQEGPCECELYLNCPRFVTTKEYVPRLRASREKEFELIADAADNGWDREVERHCCKVRRIEQLLNELGEPLSEEGKQGSSTKPNE